jgi:hypothetical protein
VRAERSLISDSKLGGLGRSTIGGGTNIHTEGVDERAELYVRLKDPIGISLVILSVILYVVPWLPRLDVHRFGAMGTTDIPMLVFTLSILCSLALLVLIITCGRKALWLLIGLVLAAYHPTMFLRSIVACQFMAPNPACDF